MVKKLPAAVFVRTAALLAVTLLLVVANPSLVGAAVPHAIIESSGPLSHIYIGNSLGCQVHHVQDSTHQFYSPGTEPADCGTFVVIADQLYSPDFANLDSTATGSLGARTVFTPVSQSGVTGAGTAANPFRVVTVVDVGTTGIRITETDSYIVGQEVYRTDVAMENTTTTVTDLIMYRAGDCFLAGSDVGFGFRNAAEDSIGCSVNPNNVPDSRIEEWVPLTSGSSFYQARYSEVWQWIGGHTAFPNTCECEQEQDNGAGISWSASIDPSATRTFSHLTRFSPIGRMALPATKTADSATSSPSAINGYTITISNPNGETVTLNTIEDALPDGFVYRAGTTTGVTTADPVITGQQHVWNGPFDVPGGGSVSLHFDVNVSGVPGEYLNNVGGTAQGGYPVAGGPTAPVTVVAPAVTRPARLAGRTMPATGPVPVWPTAFTALVLIALGVFLRDPLTEVAFRVVSYKPRHSSSRRSGRRPARRGPQHRR
ncbi:MAG TPA: hypothetical protein VND22_04405 [Actinomycetota bacterium]|nr:hypothetical protein [Actinomycetota bacterium]